MPKETTIEQRAEIANVAEGLNKALELAGVPMDVAASAALLLAAEYSAQSNEKTKDLVELFRKNLVHSRKRLRESLN